MTARKQILLTIISIAVSHFSIASTLELFWDVRPVRFQNGNDYSLVVNLYVKNSGANIVRVASREDLSFHLESRSRWEVSADIDFEDCQAEELEDLRVIPSEVDLRIVELREGEIAQVGHLQCSLPKDTTFCDIFELKYTVPDELGSRFKIWSGELKGEYDLPDHFPQHKEEVE